MACFPCTALVGVVPSFMHARSTLALSSSLNSREGFASFRSTSTLHSSGMILALRSSGGGGCTFGSARRGRAAGGGGNGGSAEASLPPPPPAPPPPSREATEPLDDVASSIVAGIDRGDASRRHRGQSRVSLPHLKQHTENFGCETQTLIRGSEGETNRRERGRAHTYDQQTEKEETAARPPKSNAINNAQSRERPE